MDPTLIDFTSTLGNFLTSALALPQFVDVETKPNRLIRAVLAHLVAAKVDIDEVHFDRHVRNYVFDLNAPVPDELHVLYWLYPHAEQVVLRDVAMPAVRGRYGNFIFIQLLKFFPVGFLVADLPTYEGLPSLTRFRSVGADESTVLRIDLRNVRPLGWPETPDEGNLLFGGQAMMSSVVGARK